MVHKFTSLLAIATLAIAGVSAQAPTANLVNGTCVENYDENIDYFPVKMNVSDDFAQYFSIEYHNNYKVVENHRSGEIFILLQCGTPAPTNITNGTDIYEIPITRAAATETTVVPYLEMIGAAESLVLMEHGDLVSSACFQKFYNSGNITSLSTTNQTLQAEQIADVQVLFGTNPLAETTVDTNSTNTAVSTGQSFEPGVLGRSSWISYYAAFYNLEEVSNNVSETIIENYNRLKVAASNYDPKPVVAWTTYDAPSQFNNNTASYIISGASYKAGLTTDAGAVLLETTNTTYATSEEFLQAITDVEVLIDETFIGSNLTAFLGNYQIPESDVSKYKFLENKKVFRQDGILTAAGGYDWFEAPVVMADALLEDMINAVNLNAPTSDYQRNWLRNIALDEPIKISTAENCTWNEDAPRPNLANQFEGDNFTLSTDSENSNDEIHQSVGTESAASYFTPTVGVLFATFATVAFLA